MIKEIYVSKQSEDPELQDLIIKLKNTLNNNSFFGRFCRVTISRHYLEYYPIKGCIINCHMELCIQLNNQEVGPLYIEYQIIEPIEKIQSESWRYLFAEMLDYEFMKILRKSEHTKYGSFTDMQTSVVEIYKDETEQ